MSAAELDRIFGALSDPTRRRLLARLRGGSARITDLADPLPVSLNAVSKHVKVLERAGLVRREVVGREHRISLDASPLLDAVEWMAGYEAYWNERIDALEAYLAGRRSSPERGGEAGTGDEEMKREMGG